MYSHVLKSLDLERGFNGILTLFSVWNVMILIYFALAQTFHNYSTDQYSKGKALGRLAIRCKYKHIRCNINTVFTGLPTMVDLCCMKHGIPTLDVTKIVRS